MTDSANFGVVLVTTPTVEVSDAIASALLEAKLAACVSVLPIRSIYTWQGQIHKDEEYQLLIKTDLSCFEQLAEKVRSLHPYEVPEIIALPILTGSPAYLNWIGENVQHHP